MNPDQLSLACIEEVANVKGEALGSGALGRIESVFRACLKSGQVREAVEELLLLSFFLDKRQGATGPARQLLRLAEGATALLRQLGETIESVLASKRVGKRLKLLGLVPAPVAQSESNEASMSLLELRSHR